MNTYLRVYLTGIVTLSPLGLLALAFVVGVPLVYAAALVQVMYLALVALYAIHAAVATQLDTVDKIMWIVGMTVFPPILVTAYWAKFFYADIAWKKYATI